MFEALPTPAEMNRWDQEAEALGLPAFVLMENASREALHVLRTAYHHPLPGKRVLLFMGGGNNGGDAAALARHLLDAGAEPLVVHTRPLDHYATTPAEHIRVAAACGVPFMTADTWLNAPTRTPDIMVDGLLGTGFTGPLRSMEHQLVQAVNARCADAFVLALDIPSGLSALSGLPRPEAVRAHATVSFEAAKPGLVLPKALPFTGQLHVRPIGIPTRVKVAHPASYRRLTDDWPKALPPVDSMAHKGRAGHVLVVGGSPAYPGAARLAAAGATRTGAGLVTVAAPAPLVEQIRAGDPCLMPHALPTDSWNAAAAENLRPVLTQLAANSWAALVLGPGLGRDADAMAFIAAVLQQPRPCAVIDADALYDLDLESLQKTDVLTPHPGEAARILGCESRDVQADRPAALERLMTLAPCVWVLKGEGTLIGQHGHPITVIPHHVPLLAVGGSGDVLAGCCAAILAQAGAQIGAQGLPTLTAACLAATLHCAAGQSLTHNFPRRGNTAMDIADAIPHALPRPLSE